MDLIIREDFFSCFLMELIDGDDWEIGLMDYNREYAEVTLES